MERFRKGQTVFFVRSGMEVREAIVLNVAGGFCTIRFVASGGGIRVRETKLYATKEEAEEQIQKTVEKKRGSYKPYW